MSNIKSTSKKLPSNFFSFSHSKKGSEAVIEDRHELTPAEQRGLAGWISSILQPFDQEFIHSLESCQTRSVVDLYSYISYNYSHLKEIVSYYIVSLLVDWGWTDLKEEGSIVARQSNDVFLNILIEELATRFYRESQWLTKIMHIPIYHIFAQLDSFSKGYVTMKELARCCNQNQLQKNPQDLVIRKINGNLGGLKLRIYQENLKELQLRVDLTSFTYPQLEKGQECSQSYTKIQTILSQWAKDYENQKMSLEQTQLRQTRKQLEELEMNRQDFQIKQISRSIIEGHQTPKKEKSVLSRRSVPREKTISPRTPTKTEEPTKIQIQPEITLGASDGERKETLVSNRDIKTQSKRKESDILRKAAQLQAAKQKQFEALSHQQEHAKKHERLLVQAAILSELENIKFAKFHNRHHLYSYI